LTTGRKAIARCYFIVSACLFASGHAVAQPPASPTFQRLHDDLKLDPSQETSWKSFTQAYSMTPAEIAKQRDNAAKMPSLTGPQRVDMAVTAAKEYLAALENRATALKARYSTLSPEQQHTFDRETLGGDRP
jgi:hypothetical protein